MAKITVDLSKEDEDDLKSIMEVNPDLKTLEDALLWCLRQYTTSIAGLVNLFLDDRTTHLKLTANKGVIKFTPQPAPQIKKQDDKALFITGKPSDIQDAIGKFSKINKGKF